MQLNFATPQLKMRLLSKDDFALFASLYGDEKTMRKICAPFDAEQLANTFELALTRTHDQDYRYWMWVIEHQGKAIGLQSLEQRNSIPEHAEAGIMLLQSANNKGHTIAASKAIVSYGFKCLDFKRIYAEFNATNLATKRILERLNFTYESARNTDNGDNTVQKSLIYYLEAEKWHF
ncbi:GNAT family N-acetyltransferase [Shewanella sp. WXL01]|uniref:GNAT family N-acetyltransferase n=1 Tax=Shewanella sp. WXL01 TaxID=2709721 RepID=UPI00143867A0|nr:GNAT family N-acetyltransferase [Shewanella sp. WXL01]NKF49863.1 GNAT family N-acetyltransferase [Shewanella sp. WXL01]